MSCPFKAGDLVKSTTGTVYRVKNVPGDPEYDRFEFIDPESGCQVEYADHRTGEVHTTWIVHDVLSLWRPNE